jgi:hypothetical protein
MFVLQKNFFETNSLKCIMTQVTTIKNLVTLRIKNNKIIIILKFYCVNHTLKFTEEISVWQMKQFILI